MINASSTTTSGVSLGSAFNQSSISSSTVSQTSHVVNGSVASQGHNQQVCNLNNDNLSVITTAQSDSFNVSSSGHNERCSCAGVSGVVDLSIY